MSEPIPLGESDNPLRLVHTTLWSLLEGSAMFSSLVPINNRIKYKGGLKYPEKEEIQYGDTPEVAVVQTGFLPYQYADSAESTLVLEFAIKVTTIDIPIETLLDVQFAIYCALLKWNASLETLLWNGAPFVTQCRPLTVKDTLDDESLSRGHRGWTSVWSGQVHCRFNSSVLRNLA